MSMAASREEICRKYNFKDIKVAHWRDPYSAYVARAVGIPLVAADAYQRAYTPKYRLSIPGPETQQITDDEDSGVEKSTSDQAGDGSVLETAKQVELHSEEGECIVHGRGSSTEQCNSEDITVRATHDVCH